LDYSPGPRGLSKGLRILFLGMDGPLSRAVLAGLLAQGHPVVAMLRPGSGPLRAVHGGGSRAPQAGELLPLVDPQVQATASGLAHREGIPVYTTGDPRSEAIHAWLAELAVDVACVACFSLRLPGSLLALPRLGFLNVHPSLLPAYRGPAPLFWQFRHGVDPVGVTVHWLDEGLDTGDLAAQASLHLPEGISGPEAEVRCGRLGASLLGQVLAELAQGRAPRTPQPPGGSYHPAPTPEDFRLDPGDSARQAFRFMRGTAHWGYPYPVTVGTRTLHLLQALAWTPSPDPPPLRVEREIAHIPFRDGTLIATHFRWPSSGTAGARPQRKR